MLFTWDMWRRNFFPPELVSQNDTLGLLNPLAPNTPGIGCDKTFVAANPGVPFFLNYVIDSGFDLFQSFRRQPKR